MTTARHSRTPFPGAALAAALALLMYSGGVLAYTFKPTPAEWAMWPEYCRARYTVTVVGSSSEFAAIYPKAAVVRWSTILGEPTWKPLHHYCAGVIWIQRYRAARTETDRVYALRVAEEECRYTYDRIPATSSLYRQVASDLQMVRALRGNYPQVSR